MNSSYDPQNINAVLAMLFSAKPSITSKRIIDEAAKRKKTHIPTGDQSSDFFKEANAESGLLIRSCTYPTGGCQDWGKSLRAEFPKMDSICAVFNSDDGNKIDPVSIRNPGEWKYIVYTGCQSKKAIPLIDNLQQKYHLNNLKNIYVITPPHNSFGLDETIEKAIFQIVLNTKSKKLNLLTSGLDIDNPTNIGIPKPFLTTQSKYILPKNCYGLMYNGLDQTADNLSYLIHYFDQIAKIPSASTKSVIILKTELSDELHDYLVGLAKQRKITLDFMDKLPQADFLQALEQIGKKGGFISSDGAQTLIQSLYLGSRILVCGGDFTQEFHAQLVSKLPEAHRDIGDVILGFSEDYDLLNDTKKVDLVFKELQKIILDAVAKFNQFKAIYAAKDESPKIQVETPSNTYWLRSSFQDKAQSSLAPDARMFQPKKHQDTPRYKKTPSFDFSDEQKDLDMAGVTPKSSKLYY